ncbi:MAG: hypothetical protein OXE94_08860 [Aestuariivita sp.]|nr:hypothetical protein [Aestuariivita sp.]MCY4201112.1 hypothetical protein [Aestuariivita sp.]
MPEKHDISKRSRRQKGILTFVARDSTARVFCYVNATVRKQAKNDEILRFAEYWNDHTGSWPRESIFDSRLTTYTNRMKINDLGIRFITLRRRSRTLLEALAVTPRESWKTITLTNVCRVYRRPRILEETVNFADITVPSESLLSTVWGMISQRC